MYSGEKTQALDVTAFNAIQCMCICFVYSQLRYTHCEASPAEGAIVQNDGAIRRAASSNGPTVPSALRKLASQGNYVESDGTCVNGLFVLLNLCGSINL